MDGKTFHVGPPVVIKNPDNSFSEILHSLISTSIVKAFCVSLAILITGASNNTTNVSVLCSSLSINVPSSFTRTISNL